MELGVDEWDLNGIFLVDLNRILMNFKWNLMGSNGMFNGIFLGCSWTFDRFDDEISGI